MTQISNYLQDIGKLSKSLILEDDVISIYLGQSLKSMNNQGTTDKNSQFYFNKIQWLFQYFWYQLFITNMPQSYPNIEQIFKDEDMTDDSEDERDENTHNLLQENCNHSCSLGQSAQIQDPNQYCYQSRIESITNTFYKNVCNKLSNYQHYNGQDIQYCNALLNKALNRGIMLYNNLLSQHIY
ncbi:hypothetical protein pb186bvf_008812 [Paramecium bursaria]